MHISYKLKCSFSTNHSWGICGSIRGKQHPKLPVLVKFFSLSSGKVTCYWIIMYNMIDTGDRPSVNKFITYGTFEERYELDIGVFLVGILV